MRNLNTFSYSWLYAARFEDFISVAIQIATIIYDVK